MIRMRTEKYKENGVGGAGGGSGEEVGGERQDDDKVKTEVRKTKR
jgi:hypothetical protein